MFKTELAVYDKNKDDFKKDHLNEYVLIDGEEIIGFYKDYGTALSVGYQKFGTNRPFFVKQILENEPVIMVRPDVLESWRNSGTFQRIPKYYHNGNFVTYFRSEEECIAEQVDEFLTLYKNKNNEIVGVKVNL